MSGVLIRDGRAAPSVCISKNDLSVLAERVEKRRLAPVRSTLLALVEASGSADGWTKKALAERAGLGGAGLKQALEALEALGFLRVLTDGSFELASPGSSGPSALPSDGTPPARPTPSLHHPRAEGLFAWYAKRIAPVIGGTPRKDPAALVAASDILKREEDAGQIKARLEFALGQRFYADKVVTLRKFAEWWPRINAAYLAEADSRETASTTSGIAAVSYDAERVEVAR